MTIRTVTERDFRMPEFRTAKPEDYEFREDGKLVRKDRWEQAVQSIRSLVGIDAREFEIADVVAKVRALCQNEWLSIENEDPQEEDTQAFDILLKNGSVLCGVTFDCKRQAFVWSMGQDIVIEAKDVFSWRLPTDTEG